jgi:hypothetical protein
LWPRILRTARSIAAVRTTIFLVNDTDQTIVGCDGVFAHAFALPFFDL